MDGIIVIDKPKGITSRRAVDVVRRLSGQRRIGHGGTLDPLASGVLVVALGNATRILEYVIAGDKRYDATIVLGATSTTDDAEGAVEVVDVAPDYTLDVLQRSLLRFRGAIAQRPPAYSAIALDGRRLYERARRGEYVQAPERRVTIYDVVMVGWSPPHLSLRVHCSKGTYIRSLARDLGQALGCGAYLGDLRRTASGPFTLVHAKSLVYLEEHVATLSDYVLSPATAVASLPAVVLDEVSLGRISQGQCVHVGDAPHLSTTSGPTSDHDNAADAMTTIAAAMDDCGDLVAVLRWDAQRFAWCPHKVLSRRSFVERVTNACNS
jgi:tRNA pseudouridine55 synthase